MMGEYIDNVRNLVPHKAVCIYQVGQLTETNITIGVEFDCSGRQWVREKYKGKITRILLLRLNENAYEELYNYLNNESHKNVASFLYDALSESETTMHMN